MLTALPASPEPMRGSRRYVRRRLALGLDAAGRRLAKHWRALTLNLVVTYRPPGGRLRETSLVL